MPLQDYYNTGDDFTLAVMESPGYNHQWYGQSFTPSVSYECTSIKILMWQQSGYGVDMTMRLYATSSGKPTGTPLASKVVASASIPDGEYDPPTSADWVEFEFSTPVLLTAETQYAFVVFGTPVASDGAWFWRIVNAGTYSDGTLLYSYDEGSTWATWSEDGMFEVYGDVPGLISLQGTISGSGILAGDLVMTYGCSGTVSGLGALSGYLQMERGLTGTASGAGSLEGMLSLLLQSNKQASKKRLLAFGNDQVFIEDI